MMTTEPRLIVNHRKRRVHYAQWDGDQLLSDPRCHKGGMRHEEVLEHDPDGVRLAGLIGRGYALCRYCAGFRPRPQPLRIVA